MAGEDQVIAIHKVEDFDQKVAEATQSGKLVVVDFTASWCPPCRMIAPVFSALAKKHVSAIFLKVDVDELNTLSEKFDITGMPTFIFLKDGKEVYKIVGADKGELEKKVAELNSAPATSTA